LFTFLHAGKLELLCLNFGERILLPKIKEAERVATIRLNTVADHVVRSSQTAFMQGRNILDGLAILHETVHELRSKMLNGVILKINFEKAYDKVKWSFLQQTLRIKGFSNGWRAIIHSFVSRGSVEIKVNDDTCHYFWSKRAKTR
jgi:hypothetical protein